jgi:membrane protease YdiL (CAAX protease family)
MQLKFNSTTQVLLVFLLATVFGALLFGVLANISALLFLDINVFASNFDIELLPKPEQINLFRLTQPFNTLGIFLFPPLVVKFIYSSDVSILRFSHLKISYSSILGASALIIMVKPLVGWLASINSSIDFTVFGSMGKILVETSELLAEKIAMVTVSHTVDEFVLNIVVIALIPAIAEEFFFRGFLQQFLNRITSNYHISVWVTATVFGVIHFNILGILPLIFLGGILGYIYHFSQNIWISILAHFINNASLLWFVYKYSYDVKDVGAESVPVQSIIFSLIMTLAMLFFMYTVWKHNTSVSVDDRAKES